MASRSVVAQGLVELRTWWPSLPDTPVLLDSVADACLGYTDEEFAGAVKRLTREHKAGWPPKLADIVAMCGAIASYRRADATAQRRAHAEHAYCPQCGTTVLEWSALWPAGKARMVPRHEPECGRFGAEHAIPASVNMSAWPGRKPARWVENPAGASPIGAAMPLPGGASWVGATIPGSPDPYPSRDISEAQNGA